MRTIHPPRSRRRQALARSGLALGVALAVLGVLAKGNLPAAHAQGQVQRIATTGCPTCPHYGYFRQTATTANSAYDYTVLDSPYTNGQPGAVLLVTQLVNGLYSDHNLGVWYASVYHAWTIFNEDGSPIPVGTQFNVNVVIPGSTGSTGNNAFIQQVASGNIVGDSTVLYNPNTDNNASAIILVTPVYGATAEYENHPIGVWYTGSHWAIFNEDLSAMAPGELFDVMVYPAATGYEGGIAPGYGYTLTTTASYTSGATTLLPGADLYDYFWVTPNWGRAGVLNSHPTGLWFDPPPPACIDPPFCAGNWYIMNEDLAPMPVGLSFNVEGIPG